MNAARFSICLQVLPWLALPALVHLLGLAVRGQSACPDEYLYTQQPPEDIVCNPYLNSELNLDCAVIGPYDVHIQWYFSKSSMDIFDNDTVLLSNSSKYTFTPRAFENGVGLGLTVNNLNEDEDVGMFWCQATIPAEDTFLTSSTTFQLHGQDFYSQIPFICPPNAFLRSSDTRCATIMEIPTEPLTTQLPSPTPTPSRSIPPDPLTSRRLVTAALSQKQISSHMQTSSSLLSPSLKLTPELSSKLVTSTPENASPITVNTMEPTESEISTKPTTMENNRIQSSDLVLFSVLGLVLFLFILCAVLAIVIFVLCRGRQCQRVDLEGADKKETGFDHLSTQSDPLQSGMKFKKRPALYHPDISMEISSGTRSLRGSGDYAEIGPALVTVRSQTLGHDYSEIPEILPPYIRSADPTSDQQTEQSYIASSEENPYDIPILPPELQPPQEAQPQQNDTTGDSLSVDSSETRNYHILERIPLSANHPAPTSPPPSLPLEDIASSPPVSPHNYHILEDSHQDTPYPYTAALETNTSRLQTIPEHPYHVLEERSKSQERSTESEHISIEQEIKEATPGFIDPEIDERNSTASTDLEDREYDRLVGPPHLYHILERSPSETRPRIREFPSGYDHLEARGGQEALTIRFLSPPTEETSLSGMTSSDLGNPGEMFDDPQYTVSPKHKPLRKAKSDISSIQSNRRHFRSRVKEMQVIDLTKYCGDYERDPSYMARLNQSSAIQNRAKATEDCTDYAYTPLSSYNTLRGSSLPDIPHIYQALEADTKDPLQKYENLKRSFRKETVI